MSPNLRPATVPFDPESDSTPVELEEFGGRSAAAIGPALVLAIGKRAQEDGWAQRTAIALATTWADQGHQIILTDLGLDMPQLHTELGEANTDGVVDIFQFGASLGSMARVVPGRGWRFVPAGAYIPDTAALLRSSSWDDIIGQVADDRSSLIIYLPAELTGGVDLANRIGRVIVLADSAEADSIVSRYSEVASVELVIEPSPSPTVPEGLPEEIEVQGEDEPDTLAGPERPAPRLLFDEPSLTEPPLIPRKVRQQRRWVGPLIRIVLLISILGGTWAILRERQLLPGWLAFSEGSGSRGGVTLPEWFPFSSRERAPSPAANEGVDLVDPELETADPPEPAVPIESPIPYSVAVEAHPDFATARERISILQRAEPDLLFFLSPILNQGVIYYRLLAGPVADTATAWDLMRDLVSARQKTDLDPWSIRPTAWAYHLGDFASEAAASVRSAQLLEKGIPTYRVEIEYSYGPPRYRVYAGAYEGPAPAEVMAELLDDAGIDAPLIRRHGKPIR